MDHKSLKYLFSLKRVELEITKMGGVLEDSDYTINYHTYTDGQSERVIQNIEDMMGSYILDFGESN